MASERRLSAIIEIGGRVASSLTNAFSSVDARMRNMSRRQREVSQDIQRRERQLSERSRLSTEDRRRMGEMIRQQNALNRARGLENRIITRTPQTRRAAAVTEMSIIRQQRSELTRTMATVTNPAARSMIAAEIDRLNQRMQSLRATAREIRTEEQGLTDDIRRARAEQDRLNRATDRLRELDEQRTRRLQRHSEILGKMGATVAMGAAFAVPVGAAIKTSAEFDYKNRLIGNTAKMDNKQVDEVGRSILIESRNTGQGSFELQKAEAVLIGLGDTFEQSLPKLNLIGKTMTATGGKDADPFARLSFALQDGLKIKNDEMATAFGYIKSTGDSGGVEMEDMARNMPQLTSKAQSLGMTGAKTSAQLGAWLQIALKGAATPDIAANNMANFMSKLENSLSLKNAKKMGLDYTKIKNDAIKKGKDPIEEIIKEIKRVTKGTAKGVNKLFEDQQVKDFIFPAMQNLEKYREFRDTAYKEGGNAKNIEEAFENIKATTQYKLDDATNGFKNLSIVIGQSLVPQVNMLLNAVVPMINNLIVWVQKNPELTSQIITITGALIGLRFAILGVRLVSNFMGLTSLIRHGATFTAWIWRLSGGVTLFGRTIALLRGGLGSLSRGVVSFGGMIRGIGRSLISGIGQGVAFLARNLLSLGRVALSGGWSLLLRGITMFGGLIGWVVRGVILLAGIIAAIPVGWIVAIVVGIGLIAAAIWKWDTIKVYMEAFGAWIQKTWTNAFDGITSLITTAPQKWESFKADTQKLLSDTVDCVIKFGEDSYKAITEKFASIKSEVVGVFESIMKWFDTLGNKWEQVKQYIPFMGGDTNVSIQQPKIAGSNSVIANLPTITMPEPLKTESGREMSPMESLITQNAHLLKEPKVGEAKPKEYYSGATPSIANTNNSKSFTDNRTINNNISVQAAPQQDAPSLGKTINNEITKKTTTSPLFDHAMGY